MVFRSEDGKMAIVAVRLDQDRGFPNAMLATLWEHLPTKPGATEKVTDMVSPGAFCPGTAAIGPTIGSEVTPPCTEGVRWFVFEQDLSMSREPDARLCRSLQDEYAPDSGHARAED